MAVQTKFVSVYSKKSTNINLCIMNILIKTYGAIIALAGP